MPNAATAASSSSPYGWVSPLLTGLTNYYGSSSAANAQSTGENNAIGTEQQLEGQLSGIYGNELNQGNAALTTLGNTLGVNGGTPNYSAFDNSPGYAFAVQQGTQAINREAAAQGSLFTPNTLDAVGQYVTGTASQNYNNYVAQLMQMAGIGAQGNASYAGNLSGAANSVAQAQIGKGSAASAGALGTSTAAGQIASAIPWGNLISGVGSLFNGNSSSANSSGYDPIAGFDTSNLGTLNYNGTGGSFNNSGFDPTSSDTSSLGMLDYGASPSGGF